MDYASMTPRDTAAWRLAQRFCGLQAGLVGADNFHAMKRLLLDYLGVALAGSRSDSGLIAGRFAQADGGHARATLIGGAARVPAGQAAFANAISAHSIELDDVDVFAYFHYSPPVFSAALAAAEQAGASGPALLLALAAGCEMMERVSRAANPSLRDRCYHSTSTCGVFGATVAAGLLGGLDPAQMVSAFGLAGAQASGPLEFHGPSMQKRFSPGPAARGGITAATMAKLGYTGQDTMLEGPRGFLKAFTDQNDPARLVEELDRSYKLEIEFKPYSCARPIHNAIDCALELRQAGLRLPDIERIEVDRHPSWAHKHQNKTPESFHAAQLSLQYSVAVALRDGQALLAQYDEASLADAQVRRVTQATDIRTDPSLPRGVSCRMHAHTRDGRVLTSQVDYPRGSIQVPMSDEEIRAKFASLSGPVIGAQRAGQLADTVFGLERCTDVRELMQLATAE